MTEAQRLTNTEKSRAEHFFGHMENSMGGNFIRTIGMARAEMGIGLVNIAYNLSHIEMLIRTKVSALPG